MTPPVAGTFFSGIGSYLATFYLQALQFGWGVQVTYTPLNGTPQVIWALPEQPTAIVISFFTFVTTSLSIYVSLISENSESLPLAENMIAIAISKRRKITYMNSSET